MTEPRRSRELRGHDPLDSHVGVPPRSLLSRLGLDALAPVLRTRSALGLAPSVTPAVAFLPLGFLLGPAVLNVISFEALGHLHSVVTVALAALGIFVGMAFAPYTRTARRLIAAASVEALVTIATVALAIAYIASASHVPLGGPIALAALSMAICASASSAGSADIRTDPAAEAASQVADLDDVLPILLSGMVLLLSGAAEGEARWLAPAAGPVLGLAIGTAGLLLFERAESQAERGALLLGAVAMLGGGAVHLGASPLVAGFTAGLLWTLVPGRAGAIVEDDLRRMQHPLVVLLLLTAGAMCVPSVAALWLVGPYVLFRIAGKLAGAWAAARLSGIAAAPFDLGVHLIAPGVIGVAFALGFAQIVPGALSELLITTVAAGTILCEVAAVYVIPARRGAS